MKDCLWASSPDTGSDSHPGLALRKGTGNDEILHSRTFRALFRSVRYLSVRSGLG